MVLTDDLDEVVDDDGPARAGHVPDTTSPRHPE